MVTDIALYSPYICDILLHVDTGWTTIRDKQCKLIQRQHLSDHSVVHGGVLNVVHHKNMAPTNYETFTINSWFIQWLNYSSVIIVNKSPMNL